MSKPAIALAIAFLLTLGAQLVPSMCFATGGEEGGASYDGEQSSPAHGSRLTAPRSASGIAIWHPDRILDAGAPLVGVAAGDFLADRPGNETLAADASGNLWLAWRENYTWRSKVAWSVGGNLTSLSAGELDGASAGLEVACGVSFENGTGAVFVVPGPGGEAAARPVLASAAAIMAVATGDVMPGVAGTELGAIDAGGNVSLAFPDSPTEKPQTIIRVPGAACLLIADLDGSRPGPGRVAPRRRDGRRQLFRGGGRALP
jgi:hypothetical protein